MKNKTSPITQSAKNQPCTMRLSEVCNRNPETTVFAHINGGGMGQKQLDIHGVYSCCACHDVIDGRTKLHDKTLLNSQLLRALIETQRKLVAQGLIEFSNRK